MKEYQVVHELESVYDQLVQRVDELSERIKEDNGELWAFNQPVADLSWLRQALSDFWYAGDQDGRHTRPYVGLVAASRETIKATMAVNEAKGSFKQALSILNKYDRALIPAIKESLPKRHSHLHENLVGAGLARLHLKQTWRTLPLVNVPVNRIRLSWYSSGRSINRITAKDAEALLMKLDTNATHIKIQLKKLAALPDSEHLAIIQKQSPIMRANIFYETAMAGGQDRRAMNVAMPIFILSSDGRLPPCNIPPETPKENRTRAVRSDNRLDDAPYLPSIRAHSYIN